MPEKKATSIMTLLGVLVITRSMDYVLYVRLSHKLGDYSWFFGSIVLGLIFNLLSWPIVFYKLWRTDHITPKMRSSSQGMFVLLGSLDAVSSVLGTVAAARVTGPVQVVIAQIIIPCNMFLSWLQLGTRYRYTHYMAVVLVLAGVAISLVPDFRKAAAGDNSGNEFEFVLMLIVAILPGAASNVLKERVLKGPDIDIFYFNAMVNLYQLIFGILTVPMLFSPALMGPNSSVPPSRFPSYVLDSLKCVAGQGTSVGQDCGGTPSILVFYILFNVTFNFCLLLVFRAGSATLAVVASALRVALSALGFQWPFLAGEAYAPLTRYDGAALALLLSGLACYRARDEIPNPTHQSRGGYEPVVDGPPPLFDEDEEGRVSGGGSRIHSEDEDENRGLLAALGVGTLPGGLGEDGSLGGWNPGADPIDTSGFFGQSSVPYGDIDIVDGPMTVHHVES